MTSLTFEPAGNIRGVLAFDFLGRSDYAGVVSLSNDATNTPDAREYSAASSMPPRDIDATLLAAVDRYDDLLRRLAD